MTRHRQLKIATTLIFCMLLVIPATVPAFASGEPGEGATAAVSAPEVSTPEPAPAPAAEPAAPAPAPTKATNSAPAHATLADPEPEATPEAPQTDPADGGGSAAPPDPTGSTGGVGPTGETGETGATGPSSPVTGGVDEQPATPPASDGAPATGDGTSAPDTGDSEDPPRSTGTLTEDRGNGGSASDTQTDSATAGVADSGTVPAAPSGSTIGSGDSGSVERAARSTVDRIADNADSGVVASLVVTRIINKIPAWVAWALAGLSLAALAGLGLYWRERRKRRSAEEDAMVDALTGISNRKAFDRRLDLEWRRAARYGRSLGLMVMDLDGFKQVNDIEGHAEGDRVLRAVAQALDGRMRDTDLVARIGGDEFAVICPETGINELMTIRRQLGEQATSGLAKKVGLSIGVAEYVPSDEDSTSIVARADESMYRVKRGEALTVSA